MLSQTEPETLMIETPPAGGARVWLVRTSTERAEAARLSLSDEEIEDIDRLARESDRTEAAISRGAWRQAAGGLLGIGAGEVEVERTAFGRPLPRGLERTRADLSCTHTAGLVGLVVGRGIRVGIDLERTAGASTDDRMAPAVEGIGGSAIDLVPDRTERLLFAWCLLEALLKADGRGMHLEPSMVTAEIRLLWGWNPARVAGTGWWVRRIETPPGYIGAVAAGCPVEDIQIRVF